MADVINRLKLFPIESINIICENSSAIRENICVVRVLKSIIRLIANPNFIKKTGVQMSICHSLN